MAQLHQVIGAILRDIAQARVTSDLYSRETSRYYEQDPLLRLFPIPRSEIQEIVMDLQFVISEVAEDPERRQERDARINRIFDLYGDLIADEIIERLKGPSEIALIPEWIAEWESFNTPEFRSELSEKIIDFFESNPGVIIEEIDGGREMNVVEDIDKARDKINEILDNLVYKRAELIAVDEANPETEIIRRVKTYVSYGLGDQLEAMQQDIRISLEAGKEQKVEVDVTTEKLQGIPETAISSIKITTSMRNYLWSQVEEKEGKPIRRLIPE